MIYFNVSKRTVLTYNVYIYIYIYNTKLLPAIYIGNVELEK